MTKVNMAGWSQDQIDNWQDPMLMGMQQGPKQTGIAGLSPIPGLMQPSINPLDIGKGVGYEGNLNHEQDEDLIGFKPPMMQTADARPYTYKGKNRTGSGTYIGALRKFLESQGKGDLLSVDSGGYSSVKPAPGNPLPMPMPMPDMGGPSQPISIMPTLPDGGLKSLPNYDDKFSGYDTKIGGFDNQFKTIMDRLDKLEQGIGGIPSTPTTPSSPLDGGVFSVYKGSNARGY